MKKNKINNTYYPLVYILGNYLENIILKNSVLDLICNLILEEDLDLLKISVLLNNQNENQNNNYNLEYFSYMTSLCFNPNIESDGKERLKQIENAIYLEYKKKLPNIIYNNKNYKIINFSKTSNTSLSLGLYLEQSIDNTNIISNNLTINKNDNHYVKIVITRSNSKTLDNFINNLKRDYTNLYLEINRGLDPNLIYDLYYRISKLILDESLSLKNHLNKIF